MRISDWSSDVCSSDLTQALASSAAPSPKAAAVDQTSEPVRIPAATVRPYLRPDFIEVPAMASVAGPGLAEASSAAARISGRCNPSVMTQALPGRTVEGKRGNVSVQSACIVRAHQAKAPPLKIGRASGRERGCLYV